PDVEHASVHRRGGAGRRRDHERLSQSIRASPAGRRRALSRRRRCHPPQRRRRCGRVRLERQHCPDVAHRAHRHAALLARQDGPALKPSFAAVGMPTSNRVLRGVCGRACAAGWLAMMAVSPALGQSIPPSDLKVSVAVAPLYPLGAAANAWTDTLNDPANGLTVKLHPGATLANRRARDEIGALRAGSIDLAVGATLQWSDALASLAVFSLPWNI